MQAGIGVEVWVGEQCRARLGNGHETGVVCFVALHRSDSEADLPELAQRMIQAGVLPQENGRLGASVEQTAAPVLLIPQFTLAAQFSSKGRADFSSAADADTAKALFDHLCHAVVDAHPADDPQSVSHGVFGANMLVKGANPGPLSYILDIPASN